MHDSLLILLNTYFNITSTCYLSSFNTIPITQSVLRILLFYPITFRLVKISPCGSLTIFKYPFIFVIFLSTEVSSILPVNMSE